MNQPAPLSPKCHPLPSPRDLVVRLTHFSAHLRRRARLLPADAASREARVALLTLGGLRHLAARDRLPSTVCRDAAQLLLRTEFQLAAAEATARAEAFFGPARRAPTGVIESFLSEGGAEAPRW